MAEQLGVIQYRGKLGNTVGAKRSGTQRNNVMRVKVDPSNPRTRAQAMQRCKMNSALKIYRALEPVLSRSWQNKKYGTESRQFFMSQVMKGSFAGLPWAEKGDYNARPGTIPVSIGSLPALQMHCTMGVSGADNESTGYFWPQGFKRSGQDVTPQTFGELCQDLLANNPTLQDGDQLTAILVYNTADDFTGDYVWFYDSMVLDTTSEATSEDIPYLEDAESIAFIGQRGLIAGSYNIYQQPGDEQTLSGFFIADDIYPHAQCVAAAFIVSRDRDAAPGQAGLRSSSTLVTSRDYQLMNSENREAAILSYMNADSESGNSDWPVDNGAAGGGGGGVSTEDIVTETSVAVDGTTYNNVAYVKHQGTKYVPYREVEQDMTTSYYTFRRENDTTFKQAGGTLIGVLADPADWLAAGYTLVTQNRFNQLVPGFTFVE